MLISEIEGVEFAPEYPELAGKRVLMTGLQGGLGLELAQSFAEARTRLILQTEGEGPETTALGEMTARNAMEVRLFTDPFRDHEAILKFTRQAVQTYGGLDAAINVVQVCEPSSDENAATVERMVADLLALPCLVTRVVSNRMRTTLTEGSILNVVTAPRNASKQTRALAKLAQAALSSFTKSEAQNVASAGVRINAISPSESDHRGHCLSGHADVATIALHLASGRGHRLSGLTFEAYFG